MNIDGTIVLNANERIIDKTPWGSLTWYASGQLGNSNFSTTGICRLTKKGDANPKHHHDNCIEILHVLQGEISHTIGDKEVRMNEGDTITVPVNVVHNAVNLSDKEAVLLICFSEPYRNTAGE